MALNTSNLPGQGLLPPLPQSTGQQSTVRRYFGIYSALWRNSVMREMGFKASFILWIITESLWFTLHLCFVGVIYLHTDQIGDWTKWQVVFLLGTSQFIQQIFQAFFLTNCAQVSEHIRTGKLDFMLLMPANTRFLVSLRQIDLGGFVNALTAVGVMGFAAWQLQITPDLWRVAGFLILVIAGVMIHYSLMFTLTSTSFWIVKAQGVVWGYYSLFNIARLPDAAFRGAFKNFFTFAIPMLLVSNVPARVLISKLSSTRDVVLLFVFSLLAFGVSEAFWRKSLRRYTSASS